MLPSRAPVDYGVAAMRVPSWLLGLSFCSLLSLDADAQRVRGRVEGFRLLQNPVWREASDVKAHGYSFREPVPTVRAEFRRPYPHIPKELCVAALAATPQKPPTVPILVRVGGGRTTPVTLVVTPGTRLRFQNTDPFRHRLYAVGLKTFTASDTQRGATREWTVPEAGVFEIRDELAPSVRMWVVADPRVVTIAYPSLKGEFALSLQTPGEYTVQAFFAGKPVGPAVPVKMEGRDVDISRTPIKLLDDRAAAKAAKEEPDAEATSKSP